MEYICTVCNKNFIAKFKAFTCSLICRKIRNKKKSELRIKKRNCRECDKEYFRIHKKSGFCSISCGSRWNIKNGFFDKWKNSSKTRERKGKLIPCVICKKQVYRTSSQVKNRVFCQKLCKRIWVSDYFKGSKNPFFGKKHSLESLKKQKDTLYKNHNVSNAYFLSKHRKISKSHQKIFDFLKSNLHDSDFEIEKYIFVNKRKYFVDIVSEKYKTVIEFNGDYWHCNPLFYEDSFFHPRKKLTALEIQKYDLEKIENLKNCGYNTIVIWEFDFKNNQQCLNNLLNYFKEQHEKKENFSIV